MALPVTTDQPQAAPPETRAVARDFILSRLGSLFAFAPLGVWVLMHLWHQLAAWRSPAAWTESVEGHVNVATTGFVFVIVLVPLVWHTIWGIFRMLRSRPAMGVRGFSNLRYVLQRLSAIGLFAFLCAHLYLAWFEPRFLQGRPEPFSDIAREMHFHGPTLAVYILGVLAIAYHLANGLWSFLTMGWGIAVSKSGIAWMERVSILFFVVLLVVGWAAVYALYAAGETYGPLG